MQYALLAAAVFFLDFQIKNRVERDGKENEEKRVGRGLFILRKYHNKGAFLEVGRERSGFVALLSILLTLGLTVMFLATFSFRGSRLLKAGLALLLGGAYSNTYDRLRRRYVVDYVSFPVKNKFFRQIVFNISDFCILIGALCMVFGSASAGK